MKCSRCCFVAQRTGLLSMLDVECSIRGTAESYVAKVKVQHKQNPRLFEPRTVDCRSFGIQHFAGRVTYDASDFLGAYAAAKRLAFVAIDSLDASTINFWGLASPFQADVDYHIIFCAARSTLKYIH